MNPLANLPKCLLHGHYVGRSCPICPQVPQPLPVIETPTADEFADLRHDWFKGPEKEWHELFGTWLQHHGVEFVHSRTDQKSTIENGWPDFTCLFTAEDGICRACLIEAKNRTGKLSKDQQDVIPRLQRANIPTLVTGNFSEACDFVKNQLKLTI